VIPTGGEYAASIRAWLLRRVGGAGAAAAAPDPASTAAGGTP
jgi:hypothetical protein